jgi:hypothetical protein
LPKKQEFTPLQCRPASQGLRLFALSLIDPIQEWLTIVNYKAADLKKQVCATPAAID